MFFLKHYRRIFYLILLSLSYSLFSWSIDSGKKTVVQQGSKLKIWISDQGDMGRSLALDWDIKNPIGCEYIDQSNGEHLADIDIAIAAIKDVGLYGQTRYEKIVIETGGSTSIGDTATGETRTINPDMPWYYTSINNINEPNKRGVDDDGDGLIDEDKLDGIDNDGDGLIDEDYGAVSESDYYCYYTDTIKIPGLQKQKPIGLKFIQHSYAWVRNLREPIVIFNIWVINISKKSLFKVFVGIDVMPWVVPFGGGYKAQWFQVTGYYPKVLTAYAYNPFYKFTTPIGITMLSFPKELKDIKYFYYWERYHDTTHCPAPYNDNDECIYNQLSGEFYSPDEPIRKDQDISERDQIRSMLFSFGPIDTLYDGDTLNFAFAIVGGQSLRYGVDNIYDNAKAAHTLFARDYYPPVILPSPKLRVEPGDKKVTLHWGYDGKGVNPMDVWDEKSLMAETYPPDHWRRINPPPGKKTGGRIFEGFRLYRSEDPMGSPKSFTLLAQYDVKDSIGPKFEYDTGIETTYVDTNLQVGKTYWYSVTSFGIPDMNRTFDYVDFDGTIKRETLYTKSSESSLLASRQRAKLYFSPSYEIGKVKVVPNPYRVDENYTYEFGGYEGRERVWNENKRMLKFTHLPPKCTLRIYTIAGEIIATLYHDDPTRGEIDWNMLSESNRTIASGVYVFTVESEYGTQIGKFVVIR